MSEWMGECEANLKRFGDHLVTSLWKRYINAVHLPFAILYPFIFKRALE